MVRENAAGASSWALRVRYPCHPIKVAQRVHGQWAVRDSLKNCPRV